jgi:hypothetical protein
VAALQWAGELPVPNTQGAADAVKTENTTFDSIREVDARAQGAEGEFREKEAGIQTKIDGNGLMTLCG